MFESGKSSLYHCKSEIGYPSIEQLNSKTSPAIIWQSEGSLITRGAKFSILTVDGLEVIE